MNVRKFYMSTVAVIAGVGLIAACSKPEPADDRVSEPLAEVATDTIVGSAEIEASVEEITEVAAPDIVADTETSIPPVILAEAESETVAIVVDAEDVAIQEADEVAAETVSQVSAGEETAVVNQAAAIPVDATLFEGGWTKKNFNSSGMWSIVLEGGHVFIKLDEAFSTRRAPDLKLFLSPLSESELTNKNAVEGAAFVALLKSHNGEQVYQLPDGVNLDDFNSIIIHCEEYTKLWSAADLS